MNLDELRARNFVSAKEAAEFFGDCDERTVRRAIDTGQLPAVKVGSKTLIPAPSLLAMLAVPDAPPALKVSGVNPDVVRAAVDMLAAALRVLAPTVETAYTDVTEASADVA